MKAGKPGELDLKHISGIVNGVVNLTVSGRDRRQVRESPSRLNKRLAGGGELIRGHQLKGRRHFLSILHPAWRLRRYKEPRR
jgi:hypothetical protein